MRHEHEIEREILAETYQQCDRVFPYLILFMRLKIMEKEIKALKDRVRELEGMLEDLEYECMGEDV